MDKIFLETTIYVILGCGGFAAIYFIGKRLLQYSGDMDRKIIKEAQKEIYEELIEVYWPKLNELMRDGFTVSNINPDSNEKVAADTKRDESLTQENNPEFPFEAGSLKIELPIQKKLD
ncbi:hypothetical protein [Bacteroides acidifaciens]|uniref:hypothetical protein n=1 Tax=Bacteroides acidifaciens TaxID=85831 RepID=UPI0025936A57|nr:hypothetical protein [Bacteroides acidifaciens]